MTVLLEQRSVVTVHGGFQQVVWLLPGTDPVVNMERGVLWKCTIYTFGKITVRFGNWLESKIARTLVDNVYQCKDLCS